MTDPEPRLLAIRLGLSDLNHPPVCHGYGNGCACEECLALSGNVSPRFRAWLEGSDELVPVPRLLKAAPRAAVQPWDARTAA